MNRSRKLARLVAGLALLLALALAGYYATRPSATMRAINAAVVAKDYEALNRLVDFPALRASVKENFAREFESGEPDASAAAQFGAMLGNLLISPLVDLMVSPLGLAYVLEGYSPSESSAAASSPSGSRRSPGREVTHVARWDSLSRYAVEIRSDGEPISTLWLHRYGPFEWKLARIVSADAEVSASAQPGS